VKFIGIRKNGQPWIAMLEDDRVIPLTTADDFWQDARSWQSKAADLQGERNLSVARGTYTEIPPVPVSARVICVGLNYKAHAAEGSFQVPEYPTLFGRWTASLSVGNVAAPVPSGEPGLDWEGEVAAYVGVRVENADAETAAEAVFGYSTFNDLTARRAQKLTAQWTLGKNGDFSGPMGPLVSKDEVGNLRDGLQVRTRVNGTEVQNGNTCDMIFPVEEVISLISRTFTLHPGDVIATGTPEGVGYVREPQWLLQPGDTVEVEIDRLGTLVTPIGGFDLRAGA
jgi:2-keto-4-pentenoate hydratase/2-oxohepta-3-ene-1,7-dioic acid hydratase in catechol pathway